MDRAPVSLFLHQHETLSPPSLPDLLLRSTACSRRSFQTLTSASNPNRRPYTASNSLKFVLKDSYGLQGEPLRGVGGKGSKGKGRRGREGEEEEGKWGWKTPSARACSSLLIRASGLAALASYHIPACPPARLPDCPPFLPPSRFARSFPGSHPGSPLERWVAAVTRSRGMGSEARPLK